jgi:hypothetical protein
VEKASRLIAKAKAQDWQKAVKLRTPHAKQQAFIDSPAKRKVIRAGRRGGKTTGIAILAIQAFMHGRRVLYATPSHDQIQTFWWEITTALQHAVASGALYKNETEHVIEVRGTKNRIRAKTAWNADMLRGDYGDLLILDEYQLMNEDVWGRVGAPMMLDTNGDAVFIYTPLSLATKTQTKALDPRHAAKLFALAQTKAPRWQTFHFTSHDNPNLSVEALEDIAQDMTGLAYEQEILAEDKDEALGALWTRDTIDRLRVKEHPDLTRIYIGVDPTGSVHNECGIVVAGLGVDGHAYVLADYSLKGTPSQWAQAVIEAYDFYEADKVLAEDNFGKDMVISTIQSAASGANISFGDAHAARGKARRAAPVAAAYERGLVHHVGSFPHLEDEMCLWIEGMSKESPNRLDALVWSLKTLIAVRPPPANQTVLRIYD